MNLVDLEGKKPINVSCSTGGMGTLEVWLKRGYDFREKVQNGRDNVFIVCDFGVTESLEFLRDRVGMSMHTYDGDGLSALEYVFMKSHFESFLFILGFYQKYSIFEKNEDGKCLEILEKCISMLIAASKCSNLSKN